MKNYIILVILTFFLSLLCNIPAVAQEKARGNTTRCATMIRIDNYLLKNPPALRRADQVPIITNNTRSNLSITTTITVPVVVHIILPNPYIVTDADVQWQIERLNKDFAGLNADSTNIPVEFLKLRSHGKIQFCLAKRTPSGQLTTGIERRASGTGSDIQVPSDPIKFTAQGGLDAWDPSTYLNFWVGNDGTGDGVLGYAQFPNSTMDDLSTDGVFINYKAWGSNPCYTINQFNQGRTTVHETGHYFGLFHIWGDDGNSCSGDDFANLTTAMSSCSLPAHLANASGMGNSASDVGDTPNQAGDTEGCPGILLKTDACSGTSPGVMYQNFMDYSDDACLTMFTKKQMERMEWVLSNCRSGLITSLACQAPTNPVLFDVAALESVSPGGFESSGCSTVIYPSVQTCPGSVIPKFRILNRGATTITSVTVGYILNNGTPVTQTIAVNLRLGATHVVSFPAINVSTGVNVFNFFTANPNGQADQVLSNDAVSKSLLVQGSTTLPLVENFDAATFPPPLWAIDNYGNDFTWERKTPGRNGTGGRMFINNYEIDASNSMDDFKSSRITTTGFDSVIISFDLAHKYYPEIDYHDTLSVLITKDCGTTYETVYKKWGSDLGTAGSSTSSYDDPAPGDWRTERISVSGAMLSSGEVSVIVRNTSRYGNNIHIDNINIQGKNSAPSFRDIKITSINNPGEINCGNTITPNVTVSNTGVDVITSFKVGYSVDGGTNLIQTFNQTIAPGANVVLPLAPTSVITGAHSFTAFTADPVSDLRMGDDLKSNDTLIKNFSIAGLQAAPLTEGFENTSFPVSNWTIVNPDNSITWQRVGNGNGSANAGYVNTFNYTAKGQVDLLYTPLISYSNVDTVRLNFNVAATFRTSGETDTLSILVTTDCGNTFTTVYKKWGDELKTVASSQNTAFFPTSNTHWRTESIDLSSYADKSPIMIGFRVGNNNGNNIFIDNINLSTSKYPELLRRRGFMILPTAFRDNFSVWYYQPPSALKSINVFSSSGQLVFTRQFNGSADRLIKVDLSGKAAGSYLVRLGYEDPKKDVSQWVIKY